MKGSACIYKSFGELAVWSTPFEIGHFATQFTRFHLYVTQIWRAAVAYDQTL